MENINNDILKLTTIIESTHNDDTSDSDSFENELHQDLKLVENSSVSESNLNDEDIVYVIKNCSDPLIKNALICNIKKRSILTEIKKKIEENLIKIKNLQSENHVRNLKAAKNNKKIIIKKRLGIPYFKDNALFPSPSNEDFIKIQKNKEFSALDYSNIEYWKANHKDELVKAIYKNICAKKLKEIKSEINALEKLENEDKATTKKKLLLLNEESILNNETLIENLATQWQHIKIKGNNIIIKETIIEKSEDDYFLIKTINDFNIDKINWDDISYKILNSKFTAAECKAMWNCYLHPKFSKEPWLEADNLQLQELVTKWKYQNWEAIANELQNQKSAYQCCVHFYSKLHDKFSRAKWSIEEEQLLKKLIEMCRIGNYINWSKITHYFHGRTKSQIYNHYYQAMETNVTKGFFTIEEDVLLLALLKLYNNDIKHAKFYFPTRSLVQLRDRYKTMSKDDSQEWTLDDDCRIIDHVEKYGVKKWYLLDLNRTDACIRHRFNTLRKWFEEHPMESLKDVPRRVKTVYKKRLKTRHDLLTIAVQNLIEDVKSNESNSSEILNLNYIFKNILSNIPIYHNLTKNKNNCYSLKRLSMSKTKKKSEISLRQYFMKFFQSSFKCISKGKFPHIEAEIEERTESISLILKLLGAKLNIPDENEIENNILLTDLDKMILKRMLSQQEKSLIVGTTNNARTLTYLIPPSVETLIGFRGLMLHSTTLRAHSRGIYEGYQFYAYGEHHYDKLGVKALQRRGEMVLCDLSVTDRQNVINERKLFWQRLQMIFSWPCILQDTRVEPYINKEKEIKPPTVPNKKSKTKNKNWKIEKMNKIRLEKYRLKKLNNLQAENNTPSTSQNNIYQITTGNDNSVQVTLIHNSVNVPEDNISLNKNQTLPQTNSEDIVINDETISTENNVSQKNKNSRKKLNNENINLIPKKKIKIEEK